MNAQHLQTTAQWATREQIVEATRTVLGGITLDPCTTREINERYICAEFYFDKDANGLNRHWVARGMEPSRCIVNPPGGCDVLSIENKGLAPPSFKREVCGTSSEPTKRKAPLAGWIPAKNPPCQCRLVRKFWNKLIEEYNEGRVLSAVWIGFSLEQLVSLQVQTDRSPIEFPICVPSKREKYCDPSKGFEIMKQPTHGSFFAYLGPRVDLFRDVFGEFGVVT